MITAPLGSLILVRSANDDGIRRFIALAGSGSVDISGLLSVTLTTPRSSQVRDGRLRHA